MRVEDENQGKVAPATVVAVKKKPRVTRVRFDDVSVRRYRLIVGDNPYSEVPLALDWAHTNTEHLTVDAFEKNKADDCVCAKDLEPLDLNQRQIRLRQVGYTIDRIRQEERRRRISQLMEWAYRQNRDEAAVYSCPNGAVLFKRYIM